MICNHEKAQDLSPKNGGTNIYCSKCGSHLTNFVDHDPNSESYPEPRWVSKKEWYAYINDGAEEEL